MDSNRIKEIQQTTAYPNSTSVMGALNQVWNECEQENKHRIKELEGTIENNVTELIHRTGDLTHDFWYFCAECLENFEMDNGFNYCPNCGRKIVR